MNHPHSHPIPDPHPHPHFQLQPHLWRLESVSLAGGKRDRLDNVNLVIQRGVTAVLGYSGAGKTSLLNLLVGFDSPDQGQVLNSLATNHPLPVYWVPQGFGLWPHLTARQHLETVSPPGPDRKTHIDYTLNSFDLGSVANAYPETLSMGERSRLSIARAILSGAGTLVMDEPLAHVDPTRIAKYWQCIQEYVELADASLIFATHAPQQVLAYAQNVICLRDGKILYAGDTQALYWNPAGQELAECLGETNWISPEDAAFWLGTDLLAPQSYRPEQLGMRRDNKSSFVVRMSRFDGAIEAVQLEDERTGRTHWFVHRPQMIPLIAGDRVRLEV